MMDINAYNLEQAVSLFYRSEAAQQANAHQWLTQAQRSPEAWAFVWDLLQPSKSTEVQFFAATTLHMKLLKFWKEVPKEKYMELKEKIFEVIYKFSNGPPLVLNRLCIALSAFILHMMPTNWPNALSDLINILQSPPFLNMPQDKIIWIQFEVLMSIAEEFPSVVNGCPDPHKLKAELNHSHCIVLNIVEQYLTAGTERFCEFDLTTLQNAARCTESWFKIVSVPLDKCQTIISSLLQIVHFCYWNRHESDGCLSAEEHELAESCLDAIQALLTKPEVELQPQLVLHYLSLCLQVLQKITAAEFKVDNLNEDILVNIYSLLISVAEINIGAIIKAFCEERSEKQNVCLTLLSEIMNCSNRPGIYPTQESCSNLAFSFWYMIQDEVMYLEPEPRNKCMTLIRPIYCSLVKVLVKKGTYPIEDIFNSWAAEDKEMFRCYRQDISDTLVYCYSLLTEELLYILMTQLRELVYNIRPENWREIEGFIYGFGAVAGHVHNSENLYIPELLQILCQIPYEKLNDKVMLTALNTIGSFSEWMNYHPETLSLIIPAACNSLNKSSAIISQATLLLKEVTRECQRHLCPFIEPLLHAFQQSLHSGGLKELECTRIMFCVGKVLVMLSLEDIVDYLKLILTPIMQVTAEISKHSELTNQDRANLIRNFQMIAVLFSSFKYCEVEYETDNHQNHAVFLILQTLIPIMHDITKMKGCNFEVLQQIYHVLQNAVLSLMERIIPLLKDICLMILQTFQVEPIGEALDVSKQIILAFHKDAHLKTLIDELFTQLVFVSLSTCNAASEIGLSYRSDLMESFFLFLSQVCRKCTSVLINSTLNLTNIVNLAILGIGLPEHGAMKSCLSFLVQFISKGPEYPDFNIIILTNGQFLITKLLLCLGGAIPRTNVDALGDIFLALNKKYPDEVAKWLQQNLSLPDFPTNCVTQEQKLTFCKDLLREKANRRKLIEILKGFTFVCRGLVYTEYANQLTPVLY